MLAAGALLVLRIVPHSARSQTLQARSFLGTLGPFLCTPHSDLLVHVYPFIAQELETTGDSENLAFLLLRSVFEPVCIF